MRKLLIGDIEVMKRIDITSYHLVIGIHDNGDFEYIKIRSYDSHRPSEYIRYPAKWFDEYLAIAIKAIKL